MTYKNLSLKIILFLIHVAALFIFIRAVNASEFLTHTNADRVFARKLHLVPKLEISTNEFCVNQITTDVMVQNKCAVERAKCCSLSLENKKTVTITSDQIQQVLDDLGLRAFAFTFDRDSVIVVRNKYQVTPADIVTLLRKKITTQTNNPSAVLIDNLNVSTVSRYQTLELNSPDELNEITVQLPKNVATQMSAVMSHRARDVVLEFSLEVLQPGLIAKQNLTQGTEVASEQFEIRDVNVVQAIPQAFAELGADFLKIEQTLQGTLKRSLRLGEVLKQSALVRTVKARFGDSVVLNLRTDNLKISTKAILQSNAAIGDTATVQVQKNNKVFRGKLVDSGTVEVWL